MTNLRVLERADLSSEDDFAILNNGESIISANIELPFHEDLETVNDAAFESTFAEGL